MHVRSCYPERAPRANELLDVLSHHLRREVIAYFEKHTDQSATSFEELVDHVAGQVPDPTAEELAVPLFHRHLPMLSEHGWLEFDRRSERIRYHGHQHAGAWLREMGAMFE